MKDITIGNKTIGQNHPVFVIAEIGINHQGDVEIAKKIMDISAAAGVDAVKFQKRTTDQIMIASKLDAPYDNPNSFGATYREHREALEFNESQYKELADYAAKIDIIMMASVWDQESADFIEHLNLPAYKVASADLTNLPLLEHVAKKGKPIILSTGMADMEDIALAVRWIEQWNKQLVILYCVSTYPAAFEDINLNLISELQSKFPDYPVGYSGHELGLAVSTAAATLGARVIERHVTLDRSMKGGDHAASLEPGGIAKLVRDIHLIEQVQNNKAKALLPAEVPIKEKLAKSLVAKQLIPAGTIITQEMLSVKSPGSGLAPKYYYLLPGAAAKVDIAADTVITADMVQVEDGVSDERLFELSHDALPA